MHADLGHDTRDSEILRPLVKKSLRKCKITLSSHQEEEEEEEEEENEVVIKFCGLPALYHSILMLLDATSA